ncbi:MAG: hypothetical protein JO296_16165 [Pseudonocardiales bacterium]|nr:hypothetical protein [Pseudonocardiales bacterium]MBV9651654.1 hypothetical protein [Pseudonocardiales bacterium]
MSRAGEVSDAVPGAAPVGTASVDTGLVRVVPGVVAGRDINLPGISMMNCPVASLGTSSSLCAMDPS